ncbi:MAG TPA: metallopeptidase TldD-related protein [Acidimicrobiales bacterium]|nr:metallopeptidase TldD-related protein [Acidimicrobiales bacterium]
MSDAAQALLAAPETAESVLAASTANDCVVIVEDRFDADVRFANNTTTTNGVRRDRRVTVAAMVDKPSGRSVGIASGSGPVDPFELLARATLEARDASAAEDGMPLVSGAGDDDFIDPPESTDLSVFGSMLDELADGFGRARAEHRTLAGFASHERSTIYLATSNGTRRRHVQPTGSLELVARASDGTRSAWAGRATATFADVSVSALERDLVERLTWARRRVELPAGRYEVILPPDAVADLVIEIVGAAGGQDAEDGGTVFSAPGGGTRRGERLFHLPFALRSDPRASGIECEPFVVTGGSSSDVSVFDNGQPISPVSWIEDGKLRRLRYHRAGALRSQAPFTPPIDNLILELPGASGDLRSLIANTERGLLLTCLWYIREVDPQTLLLTGLTRDGVYLVERGEITGAVNNFRFNESPLTVLSNVIEAGATERALSREWGEWMNRTTMPALRVDGFNMSSVSPAS